MITFIVTSYNEPRATLRAVKAILNQKIKQKYKVIVVDPFADVEKFLKKKIKSKKVQFYLDPGEGKGYALNLIFQEFGTGNTQDIFILTDGDVYISKNAVKEIAECFKDKGVGCVTGKPVNTDDRNTKYGYWADLFFAGIDRARSSFSKNRQFFECSGYLFAIRDGVIVEFPTDTSEDSIIPYLFWEKGYTIKYAQKAEVYVKNPSNWNDWLNQKIRNIKAHENLKKIVPQMPRTKSFLNEIKWGAIFAITYPQNLKEVWWTIEAYFARLYLYWRAFKELNSNEKYKDGWREKEISSTKPFD